MEEDEETLCRYGTALPAFEEDAVPSKKPITVEDQIVLDSNGKRRFHGAFTGGFSAGYWNTVGSEEGWKPAEFKSSRSEKASAGRQQNPMDFMDEEDLGEFGIAPQRVQAKEDFAHGNASGSSNKRRLEMSFSKGPIPGQPVLRALLEPAKEKTAVKILKKMGWREGQGIGERQTRGEKKRANQRTDKEQYLMKMYGCEIPGRKTTEDLAENDGDGGSDSGSDSDYDVTFAPDDFDPLVASFKDNTFGLGYSGLDRGASAKGFQLFDTLEVVDRNNKKLSIRGQAFGIGALEDDDDLDVYARDDMSRYDFSLEDRSRSKLAIKAKGSALETNSIEGFSPASSARKQSKKIFRTQMPDGFKPRNWLERRSRFDQMDEARSKKIQHENEHKIRGLGRHDLDPKERGAILEEKSIAPVNPVLEMINKQSANFVSRNVMNDGVEQRLRVVEPEEVKQEPSTSLIPSGLVQQPKVLQRQYIGSTKEGFKPFIAMPDKQERYERFIAFQPTDRYLTREQYLESLQPLNQSAWDRERELKEFVQAERMYRPLDGLMSERFVTASSLIADKTIPADGDAGKPREIRMHRTRVMWKPHKELCKRFNVPEPFGGMMADEADAAERKRKEKGKFSVFDYLEAPITNRRDFVTPVIMPDGQKTGNAIGSSNKPPPTVAASGEGQRLSSKDFFMTEGSAGSVESGTSNMDEKQRDQPRIPNPPRPAAPKVERKRTELENKVLEATNKRPEDKRDLFKSIFCSSDEEENDEGDKGSQPDGQPNDKNATTGQATLTDAEKLKMVDSFITIKPASQLNVLRNNSPPRGIFKNLFEFKKPPNGGEPSSQASSLRCSSTDGKAGSTDGKSEPTDGASEKLATGGEEADNHSASSSDTDPDSASDSEDAEFYGPKLPTNKGSTTVSLSEGSASGLGGKVLPLPGAGTRSTKERSDREIWIEKSADEDQRHSKKEKKKKKHKQHHHKSKVKSKHKKEKKKSHKHKSKR